MGATEGQGSQALGSLLYCPNSGSQAPPPQGEAPHRHYASHCMGCRGSSDVCGPESPAHRHQAGPEGRRARARTALGSEGCLGEPGRRGKRGGGHSGEGGGRAYKGPQAGAGREPPSRRLAQFGLQEPPALSSARGGLTPQARAGSGRRYQRARPARTPARGRGPREVLAAARHTCGDPP